MNGNRVNLSFDGGGVILSTHLLLVKQGCPLTWCPLDHTLTHHGKCLVLAVKAPPPPSKLRLRHSFTYNHNKTKKKSLDTRANYSEVTSAKSTLCLDQAFISIMDNSRSDYEFNIQTEGGGGCRACTFFSEGKISDFYRCKFSGQKPQSHTKKIKRFFVEKKIALPPPQNDVILCMIAYFRYQCLNKFVFI